MADLGSVGTMIVYEAGETALLDPATRLAGLGYLGRGSISSSGDIGVYADGTSTFLDMTTRLAGISGGIGSPGGGAVPTAGTRGFAAAG